VIPPPGKFKGVLGSKFPESVKNFPCKNTYSYYKGSVEELIQHLQLWESPDMWRLSNKKERLHCCTLWAAIAEPP
jgi:hypothetical protein